MAKEPKGWEVRSSIDFLDAQVTPITDQGKILFLILESFARSEPFCFPGNARLMPMAGKKERAIRYSLGELEERGWIRRVYDGKSLKVDRTGIIFLRRSNPSMPAADTPQKEAEARELLLAKIGAITGKRVNFCRPRGHYFAGDRRQKFASEQAAAQRQQQTSTPSRPSQAGAGGGKGGKKNCPTLEDFVERIKHDTHQKVTAGCEAESVYDDMLNYISYTIKEMDEATSDLYWKRGEQAIKEALVQTP
jgi:hypothetical protein